MILQLTSHGAVPRDYDDMLSYYTRNGFRVIAIAGKSIEGMTWLKAQRMKRLVHAGVSFIDLKC